MNDAIPTTRYAVTWHPSIGRNSIDDRTVEVRNDATDAQVIEALLTAGLLDSSSIWATPARAYGWEVGEWGGALELFCGANMHPVVTLTPVAV